MAAAQTEEGDAWFTTSIVDGDRVTDAAYPFTIRHLKPEAQVLGLSVSVNGSVTDYARQYLRRHADPHRRRQHRHRHRPVPDG